MTKHHTPPKRFDINYAITQFFVSNSRLTILALGLLIIIGGASLSLLKTTGFPPAEPQVALVQTIYPGASSNIVLESVTVPLENVLKNVEGVKNISSQTNAGFSSIVVNIEEDRDVDTVKNKLDTALNTVTLPSEAETPVIRSISISEPDLVFTLVDSDLERLYETKTAFVARLEDLEGTKQVEIPNDLKKQLVIDVDPLKLQQAGLTMADVTTNLGTLQESLPSVSNVPIDGVNTSVTTTLNPVDYTDLQSITLFSQAQLIAASARQVSAGSTSTQSQLTTLADVATSRVAYTFTEGESGIFGYYDQANAAEQSNESSASDLSTVSGSIVIQVRLQDSVDQAEYIEAVRDTIPQTAEYAKLSTGEVQNWSQSKDSDDMISKTLIVEAFAVNDNNQAQVSEVVSGLIGSFADFVGSEDKEASETTQNPMWYIGFMLGGIQLVFLVMIAFVSWRAALISAISIPLSLMFSTLWVWYRGENLNTLVLFSLVLVVGLVVDPALVVLEAIQRKVDAGFRGKDAVLEAIKAVGVGVMLAALTNIIAFVPFGIMSGVFGQIFSYIPFTIVPALVGSYIVPLIFLAWMAGLVLKPSKNSKGNEEDNLWPIARWLININTKILNGSRTLRIGIIVLGLAIPLGLTIGLFSTGLVRQVSFTQVTDAETVLVSGEYFNAIPQAQRAEKTREIVEYISGFEEVQGVIVSSAQKVDATVVLTDRTDRDATAFDLVNTWQQHLTTTYLEANDSQFFDLQAKVLSTAGPQTDYQVGFLVRSNEPELLKSSALEISQFVSERLCDKDGVPVLDANCAESDRAVVKYDNGYRGNDTVGYELVFNRDVLFASQLAGFNRGPVLGGVNSIVREQFRQYNPAVVGDIMLDGDSVELVVSSTLASPDTFAETQARLGAVAQVATANTSVSMVDTDTSKGLIADVQKTEPKASIARVQGAVVAQINLRLREDLRDNQGFASQASQVILDYYASDSSRPARDLGLEENSVISNDTGEGAGIVKAFSELGIALVLAIIISYVLLAVFFNSLTQPLAILYTIPLALVGALPGLALFVDGQFGFLEVIGLIILVGIVENVAIFLLDLANQKVTEDGWDYKRAISFAAGVRFRPVFLTSFTAVVSLAPLAITSDFYRSISIVIMFGIASSGLISLITTPILYVFFRWLSDIFAAKKGWAKFLFFVFFVITIPWEAYKEWKAQKA